MPSIPAIGFRDNSCSATALVMITRKMSQPVVHRHRRILARPAPSSPSTSSQALDVRSPNPVDEMVTERGKQVEPEHRLPLLPRLRRPNFPLQSPFFRKATRRIRRSGSSLRWPRTSPFLTFVDLFLQEPVRSRRVPPSTVFMICSQLSRSTVDGPTSNQKASLLLAPHSRFHRLRRYCVSPSS